MKFSQRIGKTAVRDTVQLESMDNALRNRLWSVFHTVYIASHSVSFFNDREHPRLAQILRDFYGEIWDGLYNLPVDTMSDYIPKANDELRQRFFDGEWYRAYDFVEFALNAAPFHQDIFAEKCNAVLEEELSGWRIVGSQLVQITSEAELESVEAALAKTKGKFDGAHDHIQSAIHLLFSRTAPNPRNSIKESISAVESAVAVITENKKATLGQGLKVVEAKHGVHPAMKDAFSKLYGYTSDAGGIRHAQIEISKCDSIDAKYMLISCTAFINFLIARVSSS